MYAINLADSTKAVLSLPMAIMVAPIVPSKRLVNTDKQHADGMALVLECADEQAKAIIDVLRLKSHIRAYQSTTGKSWKRI